MPFGLTNSQAIFQSAMDEFIRSLSSGADYVIFIYIDDLLLVTETFDEHLEWLEILLKAIKKANLQINRKKTEFCCPEVNYLGYRINKDGLHTDPDKVKASVEFPAPTMLK